eukprot:CAMPEP_0177759394 /NCGR_PEP_ID=MMETSP0491_2-20121128/4710_1 /TAXON_ID=63592 /ORGANISM="Tetraselmis chuii, Strain PLY429" /LENGTH=394 /DNA_ID=CAMNT_0019275223 /DNA_START=315 /DNA_END=1499 /DNA_ORIENTATION=+
MTSEEKEDAQFKELEDSLGGAGFLSVTPLPRSVVEATRFFKDWDNMVYFFMIMMCNVVFGELGHAFGLRTNKFIMPMACMTLMCTLSVLFKTEVLAKDIIPRFVRWGTSLIGVFNFALALVTLLLGPVDVIDFFVNTASKEAMPSLTEYLRKKKPDLEIADGVAIDPLWASVVLASVAGLQGCLTFSAAQRWARMYFKAVTPPPFWGYGYMQISTLSKLCLHLQLILPLLAVITWIKPMAEMWSVTEDSLEYIKPTVLVLSGLLGLPTLRPLAQSYLNLSLEYWYKLKHGVKPSDKAAQTHGKSTATLIRIKVEHNQMLLNKVAVQLFSHGALCLCYGTLLFCGTVEIRDAEDVVLPASFWRVTAGFLGWWTCLSWSVYVAMGLLMHRVGMISS